MLPPYGAWVIEAKPGPNDSNILHTYGSATTEISVVSCIDFHVTKSHLKGKNSYVDKLLCSNSLHIAIIFTSNTLTDNEVGTNNVCAYRSERAGNVAWCTFEVSPHRDATAWSFRRYDHGACLSYPPDGVLVS